nr:hypothetical protein L203_02083 [Cryptococcus depauperatus CBS 7841]
MANLLQPSRNVSAPSPTSHVKRTGDTGLVDVVNAVDQSSGSSCFIHTVVVTSTVTATNTNSNGNETPSGSAASTWKSTTNPPEKTSGPLYDSDPQSGGPSCLDIQTNDDDDWFTTSLCALLRSNPDKVKDSFKLAKGPLDSAESATFSVYGLDSKDGKAKQVPVSYKDAAGSSNDNGPKAWYAGGFRQAIISLGKKDKVDKKDKRDEKDDKADDGKGVVNGELFKNVEKADKEKVAEAGQWGLKYLTGIDVVREDADKDGKDWGMSSSEWELQADKRVDDWMDKAYPNPATILTNDKPKAKGLEPNKYYTIASRTIQDKTIQLWNTTDLVSLPKLYITVPAEDLKTSTRVKVGTPRRSFAERDGEMGEGGRLACRFNWSAVFMSHMAHEESEESIAYQVDLPSRPLIHLELQNTVAWPGGAERDRVRYAVQDLCGLLNGVGFIDGSHLNLAQVPARPE